MADDLWIDKGTFKVLSHEDKIRTIRRRLTASSFAAAMGLCKFTTQDELVDKIEKRTEPKPMNEDMKRGIELEGYVITLYTNYTRNTVINSTFGVPHNDKRIGGIPDGLVCQDGMVEIKCPKRIYRALFYEECMVDPKKYIFPSHYIQMQGYLAIFDRKWCDYVVYSHSEQLLKIIRIYRNKQYWDKIVYPKLCDFMITHLGWEDDLDF
uniref:YqaJ-like recombinase n=1 Tax=Pithovirus LCPAC404 TaxID=2506597 RepID=A0A481ZEA6_9VIRU|nr:MAG: YqaJ-like recombinase [Pithovirus LCPAC404]